MIRETKRIAQGGLNLDDSIKIVPPEDYIYASSIYNGVSKVQKHNIVQNADGNRLVPYTLPAGTNEVIGRFEDTKKETCIYLVWNSNLNHNILRYYKSTNLIVPIVKNEPLLKFDLNSKIGSVNLVDDLLSWTEGTVPQRSINIDRAQRQDENGVFKKVKFNIYFDFVNFRAGDAYSLLYSNINTLLYVSPTDQTLEQGIANFVDAINNNQTDFHAKSCEQFIEVEFDVAGIYDVTLQVETNINTGLPSSPAVRVFINIYPDGFLETFINADFNPPICEPAIRVLTDTTKNTNFIVSKIFQFRLAYKGVDAQQSSLSPISIVSNGVGNYVEIDFTDSRLNDENLTIIKGVQIYVKQGELGKWCFVTELERFQFGYNPLSPSRTNVFKFYNDQAYNAVDDAFAVKLFEAIPITSEAQEVADNRMMYGGNKEGYDSECVDLSLSLSFKKPPQLYKIKGIVVIRPLFLNDGGNTSFGVNTPIWRGSADPVDGIPFFGGLSFGVPTAMTGQIMGLPGFVFYLAGTDFYGVSKQNMSSWSNHQNSDGTWNMPAGINDAFSENFSNTNNDYAYRSRNPFNLGSASRDQNGNYIGDTANDSAFGNNIYSTFEIDGVPEGEYIIRIAGAETTAGDLSNRGYQKTSAPVISVGSASNTYSGNVPQGFEMKIKVGATEISHDAVQAQNADNTIYVGCSAIADLWTIKFNHSSIQTWFAGILSQNVTVFEGNVCDSDLPITPTSSTQILEDTRIERALLSFSLSSPAIIPTHCTFNGLQPNWSQRAWVNHMAVTDHNGFFYYVANVNPPFNRIEGITVGGNLLSIAQAFNGTTIIDFTTNFGGGSFNKIAFRNGSSQVKTLSRTFIDGFVLDGNIPQANVSVINSLGSWVSTDQQGYFYVPDYIDTFAGTFIAGFPVTDRNSDVVFSSVNNFIVYNFAQDSFFLALTIDAVNYNNVDFSIKSKWYHLLNLLADLLEEFQSISAWKRGLNETFAVIYYDRENRQTTVQEHIRDLYVPFYTENHLTGFAEISWAISSLPPSWATHYQIVRKHTVPSFLQINTHGVTYLNNFTKVRITTTSIADYHTRYPNAQLNYTWEQGDRIRLISNGAGNLFTTYQDAEIVYQEPDGSFIEVLINNVNFRPDVGTLFEIYTPKPADQTRYYEFGECYEIYELNGVKYHRGSTQDQTATQPATGTFKSGDVYYRFRNFVLGGAKYIEDSSVNDFYESFTTQTGRPQILDKNSKQIFQEGQIRFSNQFFVGTQTNGFSSFEALNQNYDIEVSFGKIMWMRLMAQSVLLVICEHKTQTFYVKKQMVRSPQGELILALADSVLNTADTLIGSWGTQHKLSCDDYNNNAWWNDQSKGAEIRYSSNGLFPISNYKVQSFFNDRGMKTNPNIIAGYDAYHNLLVVTWGDLPNIDGETIAFNEGAEEGGKTRWTQFFPFIPECYGKIGNTFLSFKNGELWVHDSPIKNNFYGVQYDSVITVVANDNPSEVKSWQAISEESTDVWEMEMTIAPDVTRPLGQMTILGKNMFIKKEGILYGAILRDMNTPNFPSADEARINGDKMRSAVATVKLTNSNTNLVEMYAVDLITIYSPLSDNIRQ